MCKVSVLMPVYNAEEYLVEAIDSIVMQTYANWELIIINDGSVDSSEEIIHSYSNPKIRYYKNDQNIGLIKTLNKGIELCKGEYIARMDADDISLPNRLQEQVDLMESNPELVLCGTNATVINNRGVESGKIINPSSNSFLQISLLFTNPFIHPSVMMRKSRLRGLRFDEIAVHVEDYELWTRLAKNGKLANIDLPLLKYRWHNSNVSVRHSSIQENAKNRIIRNLLIENFGINPSNEELELHRFTFMLYHLGKKNTINDDKIKDIVNWFKKIAELNKTQKVYPMYDFDAFLWSRWIVLCTFMGNKVKALHPRFIPFNLTTLLRTIKLVIYLSKK